MFAPALVPALKIIMSTRHLEIQWALLRASEDMVFSRRQKRKMFRTLPTLLSLQLANRSQQQTMNAGPKMRAINSKL